MHQELQGVEEPVLACRFLPHTLLEAIPHRIFEFDGKRWRCECERQNALVCFAFPVLGGHRPCIFSPLASELSLKALEFFF
jgi:hypothetical protein